MAHSHNCGHGCSHEHQHDSPDRGNEFSLYQYIDTTRVKALNAKGDASHVRSIFKSREQRLDTTQFLESDDDEQLILFIPFTGNIKLKSIAVIGGENGSAPKAMKIWTNRDDIDFSKVEKTAAVQEWDLVEDKKGDVQYQTKMAKFQNITNITLFFPSNFGADTSKIYYIGLKGDYTPANREPIVTTYELRPQAADHKNPNEEQALWRMGQ